MSHTTQFENLLARAALQTEQTMREHLSNSPSLRLLEAMTYAAMGPGKRLRPFLVLQSTALFDVSLENALQVAAALEFVHCYSLVHDDLPAMDNDDLRRGRATVHRHYDEATAILAGDSLLTLAFEILAAPATSTDAQVRAELIMLLARAAGKDGMVAGQMLDIAAESSSAINLADTLLIQQLKTGTLFRFACESGAVMAGDARKNLSSYADHIGLAFQITDDLLDVESTPQALGKATQKDKQMGKATFIDLLGADKARLEAKRLVDQAIAVLDSYGHKAEPLRQAAQFIVDRRK